MAGWRNHFFQRFDIHGVNDVRQTELHTSEPLVPQTSAVVELAIENLKVTNRSNPSRIKAGGRPFPSEIHKLITSIWNKDNLPKEWKESIIVPI